MAQEAVFTVLQRAGNTAVDEAIYLSGISDKVESAKKQLKRMQGFLQDVDGRMLSGGAMAKNLVCDVREVAYEVENIIDDANLLTRQSDPKTSITGAISKYVCFPIYLTHLHKLGARIDSANARIKTIFEEFQTLNITATAITKEPQVYITEYDTTQQWRSVHPDFGDQGDVIGFDEQTEKIKGDLLDTGNKHLTVVSIVGPGGAGKSTLAKKVYGLAAVQEHFQVIAWITVSQRFVPRDLLKEMVKRTMGVEQAERLEKTEHEAKKLLQDFLVSKRHLIVLDDVWSTSAWDIVRDAFPDEKNGSRVVLTTRNEAVAQHPSARKEIYKPKLLNEEESTRLLLSRAIPEYTLDGSSSSHVAATMRQNLDKLKELGKDLAVKCCGLPLALIVLGGYLSRNLDVAEWKKLTSSTDWHALISGERVISAILDLSYYDMPSNLRSCFMYTTAFPEDSIIGVDVLTSLWIAEGFIPLERGYTKEEVAVKYVTELIQRCMIQVSSGIIESIMWIKVHDILRDWGIWRARREGFMKDCHVLEDIEVAYSEEMVEAYRVALNVTKEGKVRTSLGQHRSLLYFNLSSHVGAKLLQYFRHLRVLYVDAPGADTRLPAEIGLMRYLRYLGLGSGKYHIPSSIGDLLSLETLYTSRGTLHDIPGSLWKILTLRQVYIERCTGCSVSRRINLASNFNGFVGCIPDEQSKGKQIIEAAKHQIQKNKNSSFSFCCIVWYNTFFTQMEIVGTSVDLNALTNMTRLFGYCVLKICCPNLLKNVQNIMGLGGTHNLLVLEIGEQSYPGLVMTFPSGSFPNLQWLVLHDLAVEDWKIERGSMESLRLLTLCKCPNLTQLPEGLLLLPNLVKVELIAMPLSCYQQGTVVQQLKEKGCMVSISSDEKKFQHINVPVPETLEGLNDAIESALT